jgi:hypothetical protein
MSKKCPENYILKKGYVRISPSGKKTRISARCIKSTSLSGKKTSVINKQKDIKKSRKQQSAARKTRSLSVRCPRGSIRRSAYTKKAYVKKSGIRVKKSIVPARCIKSRGSGRRNRVITNLQKGQLSQFGYKNVKSMKTEKRHKSLEKAIRKQGYLPIIKKLNAVYVLSKNTDKLSAGVFKKDQQWVSKKYKSLSKKTKSRDMIKRD